jgi:hypothetical protein
MTCFAFDVVEHARDLPRCHARQQNRRLVSLDTGAIKNILRIFPFALPDLPAIIELPNVSYCPPPYMGEL